MFREPSSRSKYTYLLFSRAYHYPWIFSPKLYFSRYLVANYAVYLALFTVTISSIVIMVDFLSGFCYLSSEHLFFTLFQSHDLWALIFHCIWIFYHFSLWFLNATDCFIIFLHWKLRGIHPTSKTVSLKTGGVNCNFIWWGCDLDSKYSFLIIAK